MTTLTTKEETGQAATGTVPEPKGLYANKWGSPPLTGCGETRDERGPRINADQLRRKSNSLALSYRRLSASIGGQVAFFPQPVK